MESFNITYIRKCRASQEIQALWKPAIGDYTADANNSIFHHDTGIDNISEGDLWVPALHQIIDLCRNMTFLKGTTVNDLILLSKMRVTISSSCCNNYLNSQSFHDFWMMFYMNKEFDKNWNEGANKWI